MKWGKSKRRMEEGEERDNGEGDWEERGMEEKSDRGRGKEYQRCEPYPFIPYSVFFVLGLAWILVSFVVRIMTASIVRLFDSQTVVYWNSDFT